MFILSTRRGKQFNSMVYGGKDPITGAKRDAILISQSDAAALGLRDGERIILRNELGEFHGRVKIDRIAAGNLQGYWPEVNGLVPAGCLDASGVPHYNAFVEVAAGRGARRCARRRRLRPLPRASGPPAVCARIPVRRAC